MKKVVIGADHAGFLMKERIRKELGGEYEFVDVGTSSEESVDYPIYAEKVGKQVAVTPDGVGIVVCGSGVGVSISANKVKGIRCALAYSKKTAEMSRLHNNANILATAGREETVDDPVEIARVFLETKFLSEERHIRRNKMIINNENKN